MIVSGPVRLTISVLCTFFALAACAIAQSHGRPVSIGFVIDGPWERNDEILKLFQREIRAVLEPDYTVDFPEGSIRTANWSRSTIHQYLDDLYADKSIQIIVALGVVASHDVTQRGALPKPTIAPFVVDPSLQETPSDRGASGIANLSYLSWPDRVLRDMEMFHEIVPYTHLAVLTSRVIKDMLPGMDARVQQFAVTLGVTATIVPVDTSVSAALAAIPQGADAVYLAPMMRLPEGAIPELAQGFIARKLPSFSMLGETEVQSGILAGLGQQSNFDRTARRTALHIQRILSGDEASGLQTFIQRDEHLTINMSTARAIGVSPPWHLITEAVLVDDIRTTAGRHFSLSSVIDSALAASLELAAAEHEMTAGAQEVVRARATLLPQIDASILGTVIDEDRAAASLGSASEKELSGTLEGTQLIFSERAWANLAIQKRLQEARVAKRDQIRLDIIKEAASAFLSLLRARTIERIEKDNLRLTRSHLQLSQVRLSVGTAGQSEVYRWESELASGQKRAIDANSQRNLTEMNLNRILNRPLEESFTVEETGLEDPSLLTSDPRFAAYMSDPATFRLFRQFVSDDGLTNSPELRQFDASLQAQRRLLSSSRRAFIAPTIGLSASTTRLFDESGAGSDFESPFPGLGSPADNTDWYVALKISLPLFQGGSRWADVKDARETLKRLELERESTADQVELRIRSGLHQFGASYAGIRLSRDAAGAAHKNLDLIGEAYARGAVSILDLLDAQNASLVSDLSAVDAVFDCLSDWIEVERASGLIGSLQDDRERNDWFGRMNKRFNETRSLR